MELEYSKALVEIINLYESEYQEEVSSIKEKLKKSDDQIASFIQILEEALTNKNKLKTLWLLIRYGFPNKMNLLNEWINHRLSQEKSISNLDNLAESQETMIRFLREDNQITLEDLELYQKKLRKREALGHSTKPRKLLETVLEDIKSESIDTKTKLDTFSKNLNNHGFYRIPKVKSLSSNSKNKLTTLLFTKGVPYAIAMMNHLDFVSHLDQNYFNSKSQRDLVIAKWFNGSLKSGRKIKGNLSVLNPKSNENKKRYTSHLYIEEVSIDYQKLS